MAFLKNILSKKEKKTDVQATDGISHSSPRAARTGCTGILLHPHITEKSATQASRRTYAFVIAPNANKQEVKQAVQSRYNVDVTDVRIVIVRGKEIRRGRQIGWKQGIKKAYVTLREGQQIEIQ